MVYQISFSGRGDCYARLYPLVMPPVPASVPIAFRLPVKEHKVLKSVMEETGLDPRAAYTIAMRKFAKELGLKVK